MKRPTREAELDLVRRWQDHGDIKARDELIRTHLSFCRMLARRYGKYRVPIEDLESAATVGLMVAINRKAFDASRGHRWITYATPRMVLEVLIALLQTGAVPLQRTHTRIAFDVARIDEFPEGVTELAAKHHTSPERIIALYRALHCDAIGYDEVETNGAGKDDACRSRVVAHAMPSDEPGPFEALLAKQDRTRVWNAMQHLTARQRTVIEARHFSDPPVELKEIGKRLGVSAGYVGRVERQALGVLREALR